MMIYFRSVRNFCFWMYKLYFVHAALVICFCNCWTGTNTAEVLRPRGVSLSQKVFYEPSKDFSCLDGSGTFPFFFVNDDYCDCVDGSDEPGTSACPNGHFYCINSGYISRDIPSSRVNDNICDCCDGSDEYNSSAECINSCMDLGNQAREEARKQEELFRKGYQMFQEYSVQGKKIKEDNKVKLESLKHSEEAAEKIKTEKEAIKNEAESKEKAALAKYESLKEDLKREAEELEMQKHQDEEKQRATEAFQELDLNSDELLTFDEIQKFPKFDNNHDGTVSEDEGKFFLHMKESMDLEEFVTTGWMIMKPIYLIDKLPPITLPPEVVPSTSPDAATSLSENEESEDVPYENEDDLLDEDEDNDELLQPAEFPPKESVDEEPEKKDEIQYDEETQKLVDEANEARRVYKDALDKLENIQDEIKQVEGDIEADFGSEEQFAVLKGQCFDFNDQEYTYRLCPFDRASQIPKSGGSDINLGRWGHWAGPEENKYSKMKYENGQSCWNGPSRSVMVLLYCGLENKVLSASEPNRCEYLFEYSTPALCYSSQDLTRVHEHTEL